MKRGFTLIELLVVAAIITLLASVVLAALSTARAKARDARRISDITELNKAIQLYYDAYGYYPSNSNNDCSGWETSGMDANFLAALGTSTYISVIPRDPSGLTGVCGGYYYHLYGAGGGANGCATSSGNFYVLAVGKTELMGHPAPSSPGFACSGHNWGNDFDWVTGGFTH